MTSFLSEAERLRAREAMSRTFIESDHRETYPQTFDRLYPPQPDAPPSVVGVPIIVDPTVPDGEIHIVQHGKIVGRILYD
jgi:hypothetical protein